MATLYLTVGLPYTGKTTYAKILARERHAVRLTPDEWQIALFGDEYPSPDHDTRHGMVETQMIRVAEETLLNGVSVILDFGFWARVERDDLRAMAKRLGAGFEIHYMDVPMSEILRRLEARNASDQRDVFRATPGDIRHWAEIFNAPTDEADVVTHRF